MTEHFKFPKCFAKRVNASDVCVCIMINSILKFTVFSLIPFSQSPAIFSCCPANKIT